MKKALISFAIVAAGLLVASCGNKSSNAEAPADSAESEVAEAAEAPAANSAVESEYFTLSVPGGWKYNEDASSSTSVTIDAPDYGQFESVVIYINKEETSAEKLRDQYFGDGADKEKAADVTIGGKTFKHLYYTESADYGSDLFTEVDGGVLVVSLSRNLPVEAEALKPLVESIKLK